MSQHACRSTKPKTPQRAPTREMESSLPRQVSVTKNVGVGSRQRKAPRKSRSKGLRTRTGCITCRQRHKKCNEVLPICGNCATTNRACIWPDLNQEFYGNSGPTSSDETAILDRSSDIVNHSRVSSLDDRHALQLGSHEIGPSHLQLHSPYANHVSPSDTVASEFLTVDLASVRWLDLLAADALQANRGFTRPSSPEYEQLSNHNFETRVDYIANLNGPDASGAPKGLDSSSGYSWQLDKDIVLKNFEVAIFRNFVEHSALWLDLFDPHKHFSVFTTRLAPRNIGLMKAILALSAQHLSRQDHKDVSGTVCDTNLAIQYYYETLHYVQTALQHNSYARSEEILATALIISTYEMLDESESGWQRHLKGVFWIQRSQNVDGESGGIKQAVWWAWIRQDVWAAFRERRGCLSFWKPVKDYPELSQSQLIERVVYLFSQAVNYCADPTELSASIPMERRIETADALLAMLDRWKSFFGEAFKPLPVPDTRGVFRPIWIHPPQLGVALQIFYFSRILIILHMPTASGFNSYMKVQRLLSEAVAFICGIAMQLTDEGCQIISSQCLFGAGLCVQEISHRNEIIALISACEARTGWPMSTLRENLRREWNKADSDDSERDKI